MPSSFQRKSNTQEAWLDQDCRDMEPFSKMLSIQLKALHLLAADNGLKLPFSWQQAGGTMYGFSNSNQIFPNGLQPSMQAKLMPGNDHL